MDQNVTVMEATITFTAFWVLLITCYMADRYKAKKEKAKKDKEGKEEKPEQLFEYQAVDFYKTLLKDKDEKSKDGAKEQKMKGYLKENFGHDQIERVQLEELK